MKYYKKRRGVHSPLLFYSFFGIYRLTGYLTAIHYTSTNAPFGNALTATAERAGNGALKKVA